MELILLYVAQSRGRGSGFIRHLSDYTASKLSPLKVLNLVLLTWFPLDRDTKAGQELGRLRILTTLPVRHTLRVSRISHATHKNSGSYAPMRRHAISTCLVTFRQSHDNRYSQWADTVVVIQAYCQSKKNSFSLFMHKAPN